MKKNVWKFVILGCVLLILAPISALGQENYFAFKPGIYTPTGDLDDDDADFGSGFSGEIAWGHYVNPNFVIEPVIGYFESDSSYSDFTGSISADLSVIPVTVTAKGIVPFNTGEFYFGAGLGVYFAELDVDVTVFGVGSASDSDSDTVLGGHIVVGGNIALSPNWFLGLEGKYIITGEAEGFDNTLEADLNGYFLSAVFGYRF